MFSRCALHSPDPVDAAAAGKLWPAGRKVRTANEKKIIIMSTPTTTPTTSTTKSTGWIVATIVAAFLALAGIVAALLFAFGAPAHASKANTWDPTNSSAGGNNSPFRPNPPAPPVRPSATTPAGASGPAQLLQRPRHQLHEPRHRASDHIPPTRRPPAQTGQLNTATENALNSMLANGNNQMGGNQHQPHEHQQLINNTEQPMPPSPRSKAPPVARPCRRATAISGERIDG
jgi:hypothetical protein